MSTVNNARFLCWGSRCDPTVCGSDAQGVDSVSRNSAANCSPVRMPLICFALMHCSHVITMQTNLFCSNEENTRPGYVKLSSMSSLISAVKSSSDFEALQRDGWVVVVDSRVYLGPRGVAELDVATRNSLPTCSFCHEIVVGVRNFLLAPRG